MKIDFKLYKLSLIFIFTAMILCCSCSGEKTEGIVSCKSVAGDELKINENQFEFCPVNASKTDVEYVVTGVTPNNLYDVDMEFSMNKDSRFSQADDIGISVNTDKKYNMNGDYTRSVVEKTGKYSFRLHHVFLADEKGEYAFKISVGNDDNLFQGEIKLDALKVYSAKKSEGLKVLSDDEGVSFVFNKSDYDDSDPIKANAENYLEKCVDLKKNLIEFSGVDNRDVVFVFNENIPCTGLSGQLIYINNSEAGKLFAEEISDSPDIESFISVLCHEMSHRFDYDSDYENIYEYCFDKEFFTVLRQVYALDKEGYISEYDYLGDKSFLEKNIYNYQDFLKEYLKSVEVLKNQENWQFIKDFISEHHKFNDSLNNMDKVTMMIGETSEKCGCDIAEKIGDKKYDTIVSHFESDDAY